MPSKRDHHHSQKHAASESPATDLVGTQTRSSVRIATNGAHTEPADAVTTRELQESDGHTHGVVAAITQIIWTASPDGAVDDAPDWQAYTGQTVEDARGWGWLEAIHPDDRERTAVGWRHALANGTIYETEHRLRRYDGVYRAFLMRGSPVRQSDGDIREWVGVQTDITAQRAITEHLKSLGNHERNTSDQLETLQALTDTALRATAVDELLHVLLDHIHTMLNVDNVTILFLTEDGQTLKPRAARGLEEDAYAGVSVPIGKGFAGTIAATGKPLIVNDVSAFPVVSPYLREKLRSIVGVPLMHDGGVFGVLHVGTLKSRVFTEDDVRILEQIATRVSLTVAHGRLYERVQQARIEAEATSVQLRTVLDVLPVGMAIANAQGQVIRVNNAFWAIWGDSAPIPDSFASFDNYKGWWANSGEEVATEQWAMARALLHGESVARDEIEIETFTGERKTILNSAEPIRNEAGTITGGVVAMVDITERKQLEEALRETAHEADARATELEAIFEAMADGVAIYDANGWLARMNAAGERLLGMHNSDALKDEAYKRIQRFQMRDTSGTPLTLERAPLMRILHGETLTGSSAIDVLFHTLDDKERLFNFSGAPLRAADGSLTGAILVFRDMTARSMIEQRTQETLRALLAMAEALVQPSSSSASDAPDARASSSAADQAAAMSDVAANLAELTRNVLGCNRVGIVAYDRETGLPRPVAIVGLTPEEERKWWREQLEAPSLNETPDQSLIDRLRGGEVITLDLTQPPYAGTTNEFNVLDLLIAPLRIGNQLVGLLSLDYAGARHEYTSEEVILAGAVAKLSALVIERERLVREHSEAQSREMALIEANRRMDEFLSIAGHEMRTPLTSIRANAQIASRRIKILAVRDYTEKDMPGKLEALDGLLTRIERQTVLLDRLVGDLLDVSRIQANRLELRLEPADLTTIVQDAVAEQRTAWPDRAISLALPEGAIPVTADADRIGQVITNFLTNALKYSPEESPVAVLLQVTHAAHGHSVAQVRVRDEGPGLPLEEQTRIWERFHRAPGIVVQSGSGVGLGLGLHISRTIVERHGGEVGVDSAPGAGSTFWFTLPLD